MGKPLVSVLVVVYNNLNDLEDCLSSVLDSDYPNVEIIAVDNASTDGSPDFIRQNFPSVKLVEYPLNLGFSEANNRALRLAKGDFIFLLNPDTYSPKDTIAILVNRMERDIQIGTLAPKMLFLQEPRVINSAGIRSNLILYSYDRGFLEYDEGQYDEEAEVISACGGAMFVRKALIDEIGLFDSRYFMYYEDLDFGIRSWLAGYKVLYTPEAVVYHRMRASGRSEYLNEYVDHKNRIRTILKNCSLVTLLKMMSRSLVFDLSCTASYLLIGRYSAIKLRLKALLWNLAMLPDTISQRWRAQKLRIEPDSVFLRLLTSESGFPQVSVPCPPYAPLYASTLDPAKLNPRIQPGRDAEQLGLGWYGPEMWGETPMRWTNKYGIAFLKQPWEGPSHLVIKYNSPLDSSGKIFINERYLCDFSGVAGRWEMIRETVNVSPGIVKVTSLLDKTFIPKRDLGAQDSRILGIAVSFIAIAGMEALTCE